MQRFFYVYVLASKVDTSIHYTGIARNLAARLDEHNRGACSHTATHKPSKIETAIGFRSEAKARAFEKYLKSGSGREFARRHFWRILMCQFQRRLATKNRLACSMVGGNS